MNSPHSTADIILSPFWFSCSSSFLFQSAVQDPDQNWAQLSIQLPLIPYLHTLLLSPDTQHTAAHMPQLSHVGQLSLSPVGQPYLLTLPLPRAGLPPALGCYQSSQYTQPCPSSTDTWYYSQGFCCTIAGWSKGLLVKENKRKQKISQWSPRPG